ncbi:MAG: hypothetical protein OXG16_08005 [Rhodospirillales bacterium]|nr:hypothetical protein [Rhodospirillales bacterium]MDE0710751.1 hypothetical protein [Rhodospirillales bacterium]
MPQLRVETFASQIFWLVVTFSLLYVVISRIVLPQVRTTLRARETRIGADREQADELRKEAEAAHHRGSDALAAARADSDRLLREAHDKAAETFRTETQRLQEALENERVEAEARIEASRAVALRDAEAAAVELVRSLTGNLTSVQIEDAALSRVVAQAAREKTP